MRHWPFQSRSSGQTANKPRRRLPRWIIVIVAALVCGVAVLAIRAATCSSRQPIVTPAELAAIDEGAAIDRLSAALRFKTVSAPAEFDPDAFRQYHDFLTTSFPRTHAGLEREVVGEYSLLYRWPGRNAAAPAVLLMSHLDVVPVTRVDQGRWTHDPWSGDVVDGYVWGRGALDVKCGVMSLLEAVEYWLDRGFEPACDVYLAFGHDEEIGGGDGNARIALLLRKRGVRLRLVVDEGGAIVEGILPGLVAPLALVAVAEKGYANVRLTVDSPGGHGSMPPPQTTIGILSAAVARLEENQRPANLSGPVGTMLDYVSPEMPFLSQLVLANRDVFAPLLLRELQKAPSMNALIRTTTATTVIDGGRTANALPSHAEAILHFRLLPGDTPELVLDHVRRTIDDGRVVCRLEPGASPPSGVSDHRSRDFAMVQATIRQLDPSAVVAPGLAVVATDSRHYEPLADNIFRFLPLQLTAEDLSRIHGVDERIAVDNYIAMVQYMILLLRNAAG